MKLLYVYILMYMVYIYESWIIIKGYWLLVYKIKSTCVPHEWWLLVFEWFCFETITLLTYNSPTMRVLGIMASWFIYIYMKFISCYKPLDTSYLLIFCPTWEALGCQRRVTLAPYVSGASHSPYLPYWRSLSHLFFWLTCLVGLHG